MTYHFSCLILAAGQGTRMKSAVPKVIHQVAFQPMIQHVVNAVTPLAPEKISVVIGPDMQFVAQAVAPHSTAIQFPPQGTGDAVRVGLDALGHVTGDVLVLYGDTPLVQTETLERMLAAKQSADLVVLGMRPKDPGQYGRLVLDQNGNLSRIVEYKDATEEERQINLCNSGMMVLCGKSLSNWLEKLSNKNKSSEYYLTDCISIAASMGQKITVVEGAEEEALGVNSRQDLATVEGIFQNRLRVRAMNQGVTLVDPNSVFLSADTEFGMDVVIEPHVVLGKNVKISSNVVVRSFSHLEGAVLSESSLVGPFSRLRPGAEIGQDAHIGNFVEIKGSQIKKGAKVNHLSYIGDSTVGEKTNIGAGTITCNYDGVDKHHTDIGANVFVGSNTALVAPVQIGDGAIIGAGSVVTDNVESNALAIGRGRQYNFPHRAEQMREQNKQRKTAV